MGPSNYYETATYVGVIAIVLAIVAVVACFRRPAVAGLAAARSSGSSSPTA